MRTINIAIIISSIFLSINSTFSQSLIEPIKYPAATIGITQPYFIWQDIYNTVDKIRDVKYRLTLHSRDKGKSGSNSYTFTPKLYYKFFYAFRIPDALNNDTYHYSIERIINGNPVESRYYYYLKYPIVEEFTINSKTKSELDSLPPEYLIKYLYIDRNNILRNGYNFIFFTSSSTVTFGIGMLFYKVIELGTISTVIYTICFISAGAGFTAAGYYGYRYMENRRKLQKILEIGSRISINGGIMNKKVSAEVELSF